VKKIITAQIGTGHDHAPAIFKSLRKNDSVFETIGICEPNENRKDSIFSDKTYEGAKLYTIDELLNMDSLEAVTIETDEVIATKYAQMFAEKGVAVHLDKPGSQELASFEKLINTVKKNDSVLQLGYMYRFNPVIKRIIDEVRSGKLGKVYSVEAHMSVHHPAEKREWLKSFKGGMMYFLGCHLVDLVLLIQGEPQEITAMNTSLGFDGVSAEDFGFAVLKYENGVSFVKTDAYEINGVDRRHVVVCAEKGTFEIEPTERQMEGGQHTLGRVTYNDSKIRHWCDSSEKIDSGCFDRYDNMMLDFAKLARGEKKNEFTPDYELRLFKAILKCCGMQAE